MNGDVMEENKFYVCVIQYDGDKFYAGYWTTPEEALQQAKEKFPYGKEFTVHKVGE